jgi:sedoheptulose-bisphosphatase
MQQLQQSLEPRLGKVVGAIASAIEDISMLLRAPNTANVGSVNTFGDQQLEADVEADRIVFDALRSCGAVACASSEETTDVQNLGGSNYSVAFDPLDGSSIIGANWAEGRQHLWGLEGRQAARHHWP